MSTIQIFILLNFSTSVNFSHAKGMQKLKWDKFVELCNAMEIMDVNCKAIAVFFDKINEYLTSRTKKYSQHLKKFYGN
jgi:hypothetical protein